MITLFLLIGLHRYKNQKESNIFTLILFWAQFEKTHFSWFTFPPCNLLEISQRLMSETQFDLSDIISSRRSSISVFFYNANSLGEKRHFKNTYSLRLLLNNLQLNWQSIGTWWHNIKRRELSQRGYKMKSVHLLMRDIYHIYFSFKMVKYLESYRSSRYKRSIIFSLV